MNNIVNREKTIYVIPRIKYGAGSAKPACRQAGLSSKIVIGEQESSAFRDLSGFPPEFIPYSDTGRESFLKTGERFRTSRNDRIKERAVRIAQFR